MKIIHTTRFLEYPTLNKEYPMFKFLNRIIFVPLEIGYSLLSVGYSKVQFPTVTFTKSETVTKSNSVEISELSVATNRNRYSPSSEKVAEVK